jgi:hypothetical protein
VREVGRRYGYREHYRTRGAPILPVLLVKHGPQKSKQVRIRRLDGEYEGLEEWVSEISLIVPWAEVGSLQIDERRTLAAVEASGSVCGTFEYKAVDQVFMALESRLWTYVGARAQERELLTTSRLDILAGALGISTEELLAEPGAFVDRSGKYKAPFGTALRLAKLCSRRFAADIIASIQSDEDALRRAGVTGHYNFPSGDYAMSVERAEFELGELAPVFGLIRSWCGEDSLDDYSQVQALRAEVSRLRELVQSTAQWLRDHGQAAKATGLLKELSRTERPV